MQDHEKSNPKTIGDAIRRAAAQPSDMTPALLERRMGALDKAITDAVFQACCKVDDEVVQGATFEDVCRALCDHDRRATGRELDITHASQALGAVLDFLNANRAQHGMVLMKLAVQRGRR